MKSKYISLAILYVLSYVLAFFQIHPLWDDWGVYKMPYEVIKSQFIGNGFHYFGLTYLHTAINAIATNIIFVRILNIIIYFLTGVYFYKSLKVLGLGKELAYLIFALFLLSPLYAVKTFQIVTPYNICILFFTIATYLYLTNRIFISALLFFVSFITNSLMFFFIPVFFIINKFKLRKKEIFLVLLPLAFYIVKSIIGQTSSVYASTNYNKITIDGLFFSGPVSTLKVLLYNPKVFLQYLFDLESSSYLLFLPVLIAAYFYVKRHTIIGSKFEKNGIGIIPLLTVSFILIISSIYPYAVIGKLPTGLFYLSRHQALMTFGTSMLLGVLLMSLWRVNTNIAKLGVALTIAMFTFLNLQFQKDFLSNSINQITFFKKLMNADSIDQSMVYHLEQDENYSTYLNEWAFYEYGAFLRHHNLKRNKILQVPSHSELIDKNKIELISDVGFNIDEFDINNYSVDTIKIVTQRGLIISSKEMNLYFRH